MLKKISDTSDVGEIWTLAGPVWINFANSLVLANKGMKDVTGSPEAFRWWIEAMGLVAPVRLEAEDLVLAAELREAFVRTLDNIQAGTAQSRTDLALFNRVLQAQRVWSELEQLESGAIVRHERRANETMLQALGPLVFSLSETLIKGDPMRLRTCAHPDCVLRFYDDSKNGSRRWCSMSDCGNRAKVATYLDRKRSNST